MFVDSGATENVIGMGMIQAVDTVAGTASRLGIEYEVANGTRIPNLGEQRVYVVTDEGVKRMLTLQVCDVNKGLLSASKIAQKDHRVVFDPEGSYIEDKTTKEKLWLQQQGGMYTLKLWVKREGF